MTRNWIKLYIEPNIILSPEVSLSYITIKSHYFAAAVIYF